MERKIKEEREDSWGRWEDERPRKIKKDQGIWLWLREQHEVRKRERSKRRGRTKKDQEQGRKKGDNF